MSCVRELINQDQLEGLNSTLLLKISEIWLNNYVNKSDMATTEFLRHKGALYDFFKLYTDHIHDYNVWRLISRVKQMLQEPPAEVKEAKMNEIRAL